MRQSHRQRASLPAAMSAGSWYRVHLADSDPMCFEKQGLSRFDAPQGEFKTYYVGCSPAAAFLEALGGIRPLPEHLVNERVITELSPGSSVLNVADFTDRRSSLNSTYVSTGMLAIMCAEGWIGLTCLTNLRSGWPQRCGIPGFKAFNILRVISLAPGKSP